MSFFLHEQELPINYTQILIPPLLHFLYPSCHVQAKYNEYHTVKIQLKGITKYLLIAPEYARKLLLFPYIHPSSSQSQVMLILC
jgi:hypothetical protein